MELFVIRNNWAFVDFVRSNLGYFLHDKREGVKITIRKNDVFIHISQYYCVICNALLQMLKRKELEASKKSLAWLDVYAKI